MDYERKARMVVGEMIKTRGFEALESDTPFLDFIRDLLAQLLPTLIGCFGGSAERAAKELRNPSLLTRARLWLSVRRELRDNQTVDVLGRPLVAAILTVARETTAGELLAMMAASGHSATLPGNGPSVSATGQTASKSVSPISEAVRPVESLLDPSKWQAILLESGTLFVQFQPADR